MATGEVEGGGPITLGRKPQKERKRVQDNPIKWASLPDHVKADIEERERRRDQGGSSLKRTTSLQARHRWGVGKGTPKVRQGLKRANTKGKLGAKWLRPATFKDRTKLRKQGRRGIRLEGLRSKAREHMYRLWGRRCIYPGCQSTGPFEAMHAYGKGAHAELDAGAKGMTPDQAALNLFPGCPPHHRGSDDNSFEFTPHLRKALQSCADEMLASAEGKRPQPSWDELQGIIVRAINEAAEKRRKS